MIELNGAQTAQTEWLLEFYDPDWLTPPPKGAREVKVEDISSMIRRKSSFMKFDGKHPTRKAIIVDGLRGCTVVAAFSAEGMCAAHLWEGCTKPGVDPAPGGKTSEGSLPRQRYDVHPTLQPGFARGADVIRESLEKEAEVFIENKKKLEGGYLVIMMPQFLNTASYLYDLRRYRGILDNGWEDMSDEFLAEQRGIDIPAIIREVFTRVTGLEIILEVPYQVYGTAERPSHEDFPKEGTFGMQYDPYFQPTPGDSRPQVLIHFAGRPVTMQTVRRNPVRGTRPDQKRNLPVILPPKKTGAKPRGARLRLNPPKKPDAPEEPGNGKRKAPAKSTSDKANKKTKKK